MDLTRARAILKSLADGHDPVTGAPFPPDSPYQQTDTVRALYVALEALNRATAEPSDRPSAQPSDRQTVQPTPRRPIDPNRPQLGQKWTPEEEQRLRDAFAANTSIPDIAIAHGRSRGGITSRLVKLGLITIPDHTTIRRPDQSTTPSPASAPDDPPPF